MFKTCLYVHAIYLPHEKQGPEDITGVVCVLHILFIFHANITEMRFMKTVKYHIQKGIQWRNHSG